MNKRSNHSAYVAFLVALVAPMGEVAAQSLAGGDGHSLVLCLNDSVKVMGYNLSGQLGVGTNANVNVPLVVPSLSDIKAVSGGGDHSVFLHQSGAVSASGRNVEGQLGNGANTNSTTPVSVLTPGTITAIATGRFHSIFLRDDSTVWATGMNNFGQLGIGTTTNVNTPTQVVGLSGIVAIATGRSHSLFLKSDGTVWACGRNVLGQLGIGSSTDQSIPVQVNISNVVAIRGGENHSLFLLPDGSVRSCGFNSNGQLGDGTTTSRNQPVPVNGLTSVKAIAAGGNTSMYLLTDGTVWGCGNNEYGQLANGNNTNSSSVVQASGLDGVTGIAAGRYHVLFQKQDGTVQGTGQNSAGELGSTSTVNVNLATPIPGLCAVCGSTSSTLVAETCGASYTGPSGSEYSSPGTHMDIIPNNAGCDSLITIILTLSASSAGTDAQTACDSFTWIDGNTYSASNNTATVVLTNAAGCDSTVTLDLSITTIDTTVSVDGMTLTANAEGAIYQWLDCDNGLSAIEEANEQSFTPGTNGSYAVEITANGCTSTSACQLVVNAGVLENSFGTVLRIHPNPTNGSLEVALGKEYGSVVAVVRDMRGRIVAEQRIAHTSTLQLDIPGVAGLYTLQLHAGGSHAVVKVVKE